MEEAVNDRPNERDQQQTGQQGQSGAGYGDQGQQQGGQQQGDRQQGDENGAVADDQDGQQQGDQSVQRSETVKVEDIEFEADDDILDEEDA